MQRDRVQAVSRAEMRSSKHHQALNFQPKIMGVIHKFFVLECGLFLSLLILKFYIFILLSPILHFILRWISAKDFDALQIYKKYMNEVDFWDPWFHFYDVNSRDKGFGKGLFK